MTKNADTKPYSRDNRDLGRKIACMQTALAALPDRPAPTRFIELMAGLGVTSAVLRARWPSVPRHYLVDLSAECVAALREEYQGAKGVSIVQADATQVFAEFNYTRAFVSLDFNRFTLLRARKEPGYAALLSGVAERRPLYVQVTDVACAKFHLNAKHYGVRDYKGYLSKLQQEVFPAYRLCAISAHPRAAYIIFTLAE